MLIRETGGGLLLAEESAAPRAIRDALHAVNPDLVLGQAVDERHGCFVWKILGRRGDRPAVWLFDWRENMEDPSSKPLPLSHGIVEEARSRQLDSRRDFISDVLAANDEAQRKAQEEEEELSRDIVKETVKRFDTLSPIHRSQGLRRSRDRARRRGENI